MKMTQALSMLAIASLAATITLAAAPGGGRGRGGAPSGRGSGPSTTRPISPTTAPDDQGFLRRWLLLEPIPGNGQVTDSAVQAAAKVEYFPNQFTFIPHDGDKVTVSGAEHAWHAADSTTYNINLYRFGFYLGLQTSNAVFWAVTVVNCSDEIKDVRLAIGSNAGSVWWVNGIEVTSIYGDRQTVVDDGVSKKLTLHKGPNIVRCLVVNNGGWTDFCARFLDKDDKPITNLTMSLEVPGK